MTQATFSAARISQLLAGETGEALLPTPEQSTIIEQPLAGTVLVIAGAGSGKTETMANRVVWLVANGFVAPSQVLGLTFTRKAAGELSERIVVRLQEFAEQLTRAEVRQRLTSRELSRAEELRESMQDGLELPDVSTYNAFASAIVQEFGGLAGVTSDGKVIDEATAWGIARKVVSDSDDERLSSTSLSLSTIVRRVLDLDHAVSDNLTSFSEVVRHAEKFERLGHLPYNDKQSAGRYVPIQNYLDNLETTTLVASLARQFSEEKRRLGFIEFSDQLALAVHTLSKSAEATQTLRKRTPVVLLDEVQDTSVGQTTMLSRIFAGNSVMAVGDPHQSIYGFRGASASNLLSFHHDFSTSDAASRSRTTLSLSTSWRNPSAVLDAANVVSAPLAEKLTKESSSLAVKSLTSRAQFLDRPEDTSWPGLESVVTETIDEEFEALASWMREARNEFLLHHGRLPTAAVVLRARTHMPAISAALTNAGVPNRIVGLGGLLTTPEVTDLVCVLRCVWLADADNELLRLLAGPRFRIGVADLRGLSDAARWLSDRDHAKQKIEQHLAPSQQVLPDPDRRVTLLDALDEIAGMNTLDHAALRSIGEVGRVRLREAGLLLRDLRRQFSGDVSSLIRSAVHALNLDIELDATEHTPHHGSAIARANIEAFTELVDGFVAQDELGTLSAVLSWLERATEDDEVAEHVPEPEPGTVQLITVHGAKGLEWHLVAVARLVEGEFPASSREGDGWLRAGQLPDDLRGDAVARPKLDLSLIATQKDVLEAVEAYKTGLRVRHADEERRLAYVAFTRAASRLLLSASFWGGQTRQRELAVFMRELESSRLLADLPAASAHESDPRERKARTLVWPSDPLGARAGAVIAAAERVRAALGAASGAGTDADTDTDSEAKPDTGTHPVIDLLIAESLAEEAPTTAATEITRLTASSFHEFVDNPHEAERRRLRPMPIRPYRRTRTGNLFHEWVERRASTAIGTSLPLAGVDFEGELFDESNWLSSGEGQTSHQAELQELIDQFERSRWAHLRPIAVELEIAIPFAGRTLICKLDAVYRHHHEGPDNHEGSERYEIVDWKSGRAPSSDAERSSRFLQLDLYRHAYAVWAGVAPEQIDVTLFYVADAIELRSSEPRSLEQLEQLWLSALAETES